MAKRPEEIVFATENQFRLTAIEGASYDSNITTCCGGEEPWSCPTHVAMFKLYNAIHSMPLEERVRLLRQMGSEKAVAIGTDVNNGLFGENWIKPIEEDGEKAIFRHLMTMAQAGYYEIRGGTAVRNGVAVLGGETVVVGLTDFARKALALPSENFMQEYYEFMGRLNHHPDGRALAMKISGGIDLLTLVAMGLVDSINGIRLDEAKSDEVLLEALRVALISIDPRVLNKVAPGWGDELGQVAVGMMGELAQAARQERPGYRMPA